MGNISRAKQLYEEAISEELDFFERFWEMSYVPKTGSAPCLLSSGQKGCQFMEEAAELGYAPAQYQLGLFYWFGFDRRERMCAHIEDPHEQTKAMMELENQERSKALSLLDYAARQNHGEACLLLGDIYSDAFDCHGIYQKSDAHLAFSYYKEGAQAGCSEAMCRLGYCYYYGFGTDENNDEAFKWFINARTAGCDSMWPLLGECYHKGFGTHQDIHRAIEAYTRSINPAPSSLPFLQGLEVGTYASTRLNLADIYLGTCGFRYADIPKAKELAESAPDKGPLWERAQAILNDIPRAEAEYQRWKAANAPAPQPSSGGSSSVGSSGGCYVATAVYGSYDCPQVWTLRRFRDFTLAETWYGRAFIRTYYAISPTLVKWFGHTAWFKSLWKGPLDRLVQQLQKDGVESTPYQDQIW